jgi:hypothetical protein
VRATIRGDDHRRRFRHRIEVLAADLDDRRIADG